MAQALAVPIAVDRHGQMLRQEPADAVVSLIGVMASTSAGFWPHARWFGLLELFLESKAELQELPRLADAINVALKQLGIEEVAVVSIRNAAGDHGARGFDITLKETGQPPIVKSLNT